MSKLASEFTFSHEELVSLMLKSANVHEGLWALSVNFKLGAGVFGANEKDVAPTGFVSVEALGVRRAPGVGPMVFDAAQLNPAP